MEKLFARDDFPAMLHQHEEQFVFDRGKVDFGIIDEHLVVREIDLKAAVANTGSSLGSPGYFGLVLHDSDTDGKEGIALLYIYCWFR